MNTEKLHDWMQVAGTFALVASLIFVGVQIKQDREIAKVEMYQARAAAVVETLTAGASNLTALAAWLKTSVGDPDEEIRMEGWAAPLSAQEFLSAYIQIQAYLALTDNSYFQFQEGYLPEDHWLSVRAIAKRNVSEVPVYRSVLEMSLEGFRPAFRDELVKIMAEVDQEVSE